jgi:DNA-binding MarR family transcriptional regulator
MVSVVQATVRTAADREALQRDLYAMAAHLLRRANLGTFDMVAELDLSFTQIKALCVLEADDTERSVGELASSLGSSLPAMSRAVEGLSERGLVEREEDTSDRRVKRVCLTAAGRKVPAALNEGRLSALAELIEDLSEEEAQALATALEPIVECREEIAAQRPQRKGRRA